uniref:Uncharacterized protein n=1 Tax=Cacopsylla melanoneura TaxID=428564 RepID=A0A8D9AMX8_9HEMI
MEMEGVSYRTVRHNFLELSLSLSCKHRLIIFRYILPHNFPHIRSVIFVFNRLWSIPLQPFPMRLLALRIIKPRSRAVQRIAPYIVVRQGGRRVADFLPNSAGFPIRTGV